MVVSFTIESQVNPTTTLTGSSFFSGISSDLNVALRVPALKPSAKANTFSLVIYSEK